MNSFSKFLPYGIVHSKFNLRKMIRSFLPVFMVGFFNRRNQAKRFTADFLKHNYVSDLTDPEKWTILGVLLSLERKQSDVNYLEIGIYAGGTIRFLKENSNYANFTGIDLFEDFKPSDDNTHIWKNYTIEQVQEALGKDRVELFKGDSSLILRALQNGNKKFDIIFIDGNHTYSATKSDFESALPLLKNGGYIIFHNCSPGLTQEDKFYIKQDGGPWMLTLELTQNSSFSLVEKVDRLRLFLYGHKDY